MNSAQLAFVPVLGTVTKVTTASRSVGKGDGHQRTFNDCLTEH